MPARPLRRTSSEVSKYGGRIGFDEPGSIHGERVPAALASSRRTSRCAPSVDLGWGDSLFSILGNADLQYSFSGKKAVPFAGAGLGIAYYNFDESDNSETDIGLNVYGGAR